MPYVLRTLLLLLLGACSSPAAAYNILGLFPYPGRSHFVVFDALMTELAGRGHRVTVYTAVPTRPPFRSPNYSQVDLAGCFRLPDILSVHQMARSGRDKWRFAGDTLFRFMPSAEQLAECAPLLRLWNASADEAAAYDLLVTETFNTDVFLLFGHQLRLPVIAFHSSLPLPWMRDAVALPRHAAYIPHPYSELAAPLAFAQRLENLLLDAYSWSAYRLKSQRFYDEAASRLFRPEPPPIGRLLTRVSMLFLYEHSTANQAQPTVPAVASVAGLNIEPARPVSQDLEKFINESKDGVVYFCMGSLLRGESFPEEKRNAFLYAFSKIPQRVVWKWEGNELPGKTDNIRTSKWMPQRDILAHPNIKLFISHGGLLGTSEAVYEGVPILGIPIFGDQKTNIKAIEANGAGELLDYNDISNETVLLRIQKILADPEYKKRAKELSNRYRDRPMSPLDTAVYWTEYVIRHKGAAHLKTVAVDMPWYQYLLLDVLAFLVVVLAASLLLLYYASKIALSLLVPGSRRPAGTAKAKRA